MWFETLTGFKEESPEQVRSNLEVSGSSMTSLVNGRSWSCGSLETPTLAELRSRVTENRISSGQIEIREVIGDAKALHADAGNSGALFQVASQFNLLEMSHPGLTPEDGVAIYDGDRTQGPACAIAAGAGTIYRNYFAGVNGQTGQSRNNQIDCLQGIGELLGNHDERLWKMQNGYALATEAGLDQLSRRFNSMTDNERDELRQALRIGVHRDTQVTLDGSSHLVSQAYCSALPLGYIGAHGNLWKDFARLVLEASYEATLCAGLLNFARTGNNKIFLTLVGGGVFQNDITWIIAAIERAVEKYSNTGLDIAIVSYKKSKPQVQELIGCSGA